MNKYFDKLLKIKFYIFVTRHMKTWKQMSFWGMWISFEIHWVSLIRMYFIM
jgi:hypothetical protein